jgi:hypothetical protein
MPSTVALQPLLTILASLTGCVNLSDDALPDHRGCGSGFDNANKFMSQHSGEAEVAFRDFKVRVTDAGLQKAYETFTPTSRRLRLVFDPEFAVKYQGSHSVCLIRDLGHLSVIPAKAGIHGLHLCLGTHSKFRVAMLILCNPTLEHRRIYGSE